MIALHDGYLHLLEGVISADCYGPYGAILFAEAYPLFSVAGWDEGVLGMQLGETAKLKVWNVLILLSLLYTCVIVM